MAYQSLYRRYRPQTFGEVVGQEHVVAALKNAAAEDRVAHAYLFSGPRGTGKTSMARILAKVLNCEAPVDGEPCGQCDSCVAIEAGRSFDVREYDAASNSKVEEMRTLLENVATGSGGRTKVYILDEVHMLSQGASNALLKTLEEPPDHVVFVLATTEAHRVLPTIRSRTQHLELGLLPADALAAHVRWVVQDAGLQVDDAAIDQVLQQGGGSARDTLSALERVVATGGEAATEDRVDDLVEAICEEDGSAALVALVAHLARGRDPRVVGEELLGRLRDAFLTSMGVDVPHLPEGEREAAAGWSSRLGAAGATRAMEALGEALVEMRQAPDPRVPLEVALIRITRSAADTSMEGVLVRLERLEQAVQSGGPPQRVAASTVEEPPQAKEAEAGALPDPTPDEGADGSPAAAGRARLAARKARGGGAPSTPPARDRGGDRPSRPAPRDRAASRRPAAPVEPAEPAEPEPAAPASPPPASEPATQATTSEPPATAASQPPPLDGFPTRDDLTLAWGDKVLDDLPTKVRNRFSAGRFARVEDGVAVYAMESQPLVDRCEQVRPDAEQALAVHFGRPIPIRLVVEGSEAPAPSSSASVPAPAGGSPSELPVDDEAVDLDELTDASDAAVSGLDLLTEAFPGAEVVERTDE